MLFVTILGFTTAISLSYFNHITTEFWKRILIIFLTFNLLLLVESIHLTDILPSFNHLITYDLKTFAFLCLTLISGLAVLYIPVKDGSNNASVYPNTSFFPKYHAKELYHLGSDDLIQTGSTERYLLILTLILGGVLLICSEDILTIFLGLELQSYSVYLLAASYKNYEPSESAGLKYFLLGALSSTFILMGFILLYISTGTCNLTQNMLIVADASKFAYENLLTLYDVDAAHINYDILPVIGFLLVFIGISWKIAAAPVHAWSIDVYDAVPGRLTAVLSTLPKIGLFCFNLKVFEQLRINHFIAPDTDSFFQIVIGVVILSLLLGAVLGLRQSRIKRLLAYSSVLNVGFILMAGVCCASFSHSATSVFYTVQYILTTVGIWICLTNLPKEITLNSQLQGLSSAKKTWSAIFNKNVLSATCLTLLVLSTAGIPPMIGFFAKYDVILLSVEQGYITLSLIAIGASLVSTVYYLNLVKNIWFVYPVSPVLENIVTYDLDKLYSVRTANGSTSNVLTNEQLVWTNKIFKQSPTEGLVLVLLTLIIVLYIFEDKVIGTFTSIF